MTCMSASLKFSEDGKPSTPHRRVPRPKISKLCWCFSPNIWACYRRWIGFNHDDGLKFFWDHDRVPGFDQKLLCRSNASCSISCCDISISMLHLVGSVPFDGSRLSWSQHSILMLSDFWSSRKLLWTSFCVYIWKLSNLRRESMDYNISKAVWWSSGCLWKVYLVRSLAPMEWQSLIFSTRPQHHDGLYWSSLRLSDCNTRTVPSPNESLEDVSSY